MSGHLTEEQQDKILLGEPAAEAAEHVAECAECSAEVERMRAALGGYGAAVRDGAARPEGFWAWQRRAILARLRPATARTQKLAWAGAMVLLVLMAVALHFQARPERLETPYDPDEALLIDVARTVRSEVPSALQPAALLTWEMDQAARQGSGARGQDSGVKKGERR
jgi:hypothetical protein